VTGEIWAFDVDGCLVDSMTGTSLRPHAAEILALLHGTGRTVVLWSAGGREHAAAMADRHGFTHLLHGMYDKLGRDQEGRLTTAHLPLPHRPDVVVDDRPEDAPAGTRVVAVGPYIAPDDEDRGLTRLLQDLRRGGSGAAGVGSGA
jgi:hypothetical protein